MPYFALAAALTRLTIWVKEQKDDKDDNYDVARSTTNPNAEKATTDPTSSTTDNTIHDGGREGAGTPEVAAATAATAKIAAGIPKMDLKVAEDINTGVADLSGMRTNQAAKLGGRMLKRLALRWGITVSKRRTVTTPLSPAAPPPARATGGSKVVNTVVAVAHTDCDTPPGDGATDVLQLDGSGDATVVYYVDYGKDQQGGRRRRAAVAEVNIRAGGDDDDDDRAGTVHDSEELEADDRPLFSSALDAQQEEFENRFMYMWDRGSSLTTGGTGW